MSSSLPDNLPDNYTYIAVGEGQFRVRDIDTEESALVSMFYRDSVLVLFSCCQFKVKFPAFLMHLIAHFIYDCLVC